MNSAFNGQILAEKLSKLNSSQQSIETLSHWCIFHRKKARQVVETWDKQFRALPNEQRIPFLYLANDILQNSRRRGGEFVTEFWRILPGALKDVIERGDEHGCNVVLRLVDIWEERKVFGSRAHSLREELLGKDPPPELPVGKIKSSHKIKIKVPVGGIQEKLASAYRSVRDIATDEDATLGRCNAAARRIEGLEKEASNLQSKGDLQDSTLADELEEQRNVLLHCIEQLEMSAMARAAVVSHLKEALREQESKLDLIRAQLQLAQTQSRHAANLRQHLLNSSPNLGEIIQHEVQEAADIARDNPMNQHLANQSAANVERLPRMPAQMIAPLSAEPTRQSAAAAAAAEIAAKLAASTSSAQVLTLALSSLAAEEAASSLTTTSAPTEVLSSNYPPDKRHRLEGQVQNVYNFEGSLSYSHQFPSSQLHSNTMQQLQEPPQAVQQPSSLLPQQPPRPPLPPQPHFSGNSPNMFNIPNYGYGGMSQPHPATFQSPPIRMHHMVVPQNIAPRSNSPFQPPGTFYSHPPVPAPPMPRQ